DGADIAHVHAMAAVMARASADRTLLTFQQNRFANRNQLDPDFRQSLPRDGFGAAQPRRFGHEIAVGQLRQALARAKDMHLALGVTVKRRNLFVAQRPIFLDAAERTLVKIVSRKPQADGVPVERAPSERANAVNANVVAPILNRIPDVVTVKRRLFEKPESAFGNIVRHVDILGFFTPVLVPVFYRDFTPARRCQLFDHKAAGGAGADNAHVVDLLFNYLHASSVLKYRLTIAHCSLIG